MIDRERVLKVLEGYDEDRVSVGVIGSHSALDVCDGAAEEGLHTIAVCERGREAPYARYFRAVRDASGKLVRGAVDEPLVFQKFSEVLTKKVQEYLRNRNTIFVPNRSFTSYCSLDGIEGEFLVPLFGSRNLLRTEDRAEKKSYYWLLEKAKLPIPDKVAEPEDIDALVIVKLPHKTKKLERGFFTAASAKEYREKSGALLKHGVISKGDLAAARIERYIIGPVFNFDFFYSPLEGSGERLELLGVDWRFETSLDGHVRLPAGQQLTLGEQQKIPGYIVIGHNSATLRESALTKVFELAERWVRATQDHYAPGIIGPFTLQTCVDAEEDFYIYDVSPRIGGGTNVHMAVGHPYGNALWRRTMSTGRRVAVEIRRGVDEGRLDEIVT
ncbi:MAG: formate--phosphoribosylaminoimidazolecarboxamide ligase family protein [Methanobacteriota archaeon]|nr:MAG: formate--phosphoribosylaminoimidazolecarboxamide ligase family protein [Euryarchaeota archaeon]